MVVRQPALGPVRRGDGRNDSLAPGRSRRARTASRKCKVRALSYDRCGRRVPEWWIGPCIKSHRPIAVDRACDRLRVGWRNRQLGKPVRIEARLHDAVERANDQAPLCEQLMGPLNLAIDGRRITLVRLVTAIQITCFAPADRHLLSLHERPPSLQKSHSAL